ncbi:uncharacterized protein HD556DRAFT_1527450 [Suillus plorans]|uniref:Uncharacterized protein n=1 Tax=Suillus plorans TaxID=116603 RepID=A0A9P7APA9_9AGAM|nr:uncharacterized protein HD556DRAFT_1527450 [Suillus plorans]KAG1793672.1 hypothetical protein HD556DRAFT_1527450 [Suillus plorans]
MATALNHAPTPTLMVAALNHTPTPTHNILMVATLNHAPTPTYNILMAAALNHTPMPIYNIPVIVIACEETETSSLALGKKLNLKELRLASEDLLADFFMLNKNSMSLLSLTSETFPKVVTMVDALITSSSSIFALHWMGAHHTAHPPPNHSPICHHTAHPLLSHSPTTFSPQPQPSNGSSNNDPPIDPCLLQAPPSFPSLLSLAQCFGIPPPSLSRIQQNCRQTISHMCTSVDFCFIASHLEECSIEEMRTEMQSRAPALWDLLGLLLGADSSSSFEDVKDADGDIMMGSLQRTSSEVYDEEDDYWGDVDDLDLDAHTTTKQTMR